MTGPPLLVVGGGLAGCEASWQLAEAGHEVTLIEMRPAHRTPVHTTGDLAELVCSNSLRGDAPTNAVGVLKAEMEALGSLIIHAARSASVPAGGALAVDRVVFSRLVTDRIAAHPRITLERREFTVLPDGPAIIATGPLTSTALHGALEELLGERALAFFDAIAPIVAADSLDRRRLFQASRYDKGGGADYLNSALDQDQYERFVDALLTAEKVSFKPFEMLGPRYFDGCLPIEVMAERGRDTLRYGPMKPVGLIDPATGLQPWAVVQLRQDDVAAEHWNLVGFQTKLTHSEQVRIFRTLPGLENARFVRLGMIHRNTFVNAPRVLDRTLRLRQRPGVRLAGQITGVEGYVESAACGLLAARFLASEIGGRELAPPPPSTALGGLMRHLMAADQENFQPANINWGLMETPPAALRERSRRGRRLAHAAHAIEQVRAWGAGVGGERGDSRSDT
jgi:methylenetetrahydrofolate--tRNA-(uracil-5-)-methyltransferase